MEFELSKHAINQMIRRSIMKEQVESVVEQPDSIIVQDSDTKVYSKLITENSKNYLYRVFVNCVRNPTLIITVYKTSKTKKYGNKI
jgi:hypothetical protein